MTYARALFQYWLERREYERRQKEEKRRQISFIYLPTEEEVRIITARRNAEPVRKPELPRTAVEVGSIAFSVVIGSVYLYQRENAYLSFALAAVLGFLVTGLVIRLVKR